MKPMKTLKQYLEDTKMNLPEDESETTDSSIDTENTFGAIDSTTDSEASEDSNSDFTFTVNDEDETVEVCVNLSFKAPKSDSIDKEQIAELVKEFKSNIETKLGIGDEVLLTDEEV